ncbi:hypothetical protein [Sutcliffiella horikoshii]|uniref:hypothetical protein n=1 Tax=Sutcliffiella horikoshii TaxID=79883 RepID=UPI00384F677E
MREINLSEISTKNGIKIMMENTEFTTFKELAEALGMPKTTLISAINNNALRLRDLQRITKLLGYKVQVVKEGE